MDSLVSNDKLGGEDLGPRIDCFMCDGSFFVFQYNDHLKMCMKKSPLYQNKEKLEQSKQITNGKDTKDREESKTQEKGGEEEKVKEEEQQKQVQNEEEQKKQQKRQRERDYSWLQRFQSHKQKVSRIKKSRVNEPKPKERKQSFENQPIVQQFNDWDLLTEIPCPFCGQMLLLSQIDHIQNCDKSTECRHCKDKYPKSLIGSHIKVCTKKKKSFIRSQIAREENGRIIHPPMRFSNQRPEQKKKQSNYRYQPNRERNRPRMAEEYDPRVLEDRSQMKRQQLKGLNERQLNSLQWQMYIPSQSQSQYTDCVICGLDFQIAQQVITLPCHHIFHKECLLPWLQQRSTCPTCKTNIVH